jgi:hypothetical protein
MWVADSPKVISTVVLSTPNFGKAVRFNVAGTGGHQDSSPRVTRVRAARIRGYADTRVQTLVPDMQRLYNIIMARN